MKNQNAYKEKTIPWIERVSFFSSIKMEESSEKQTERIVNKVIDEEMKKSYLDYAMSVIIGRALPDVRDGLKPVHRRVLYTMWESGLLHNKPFRKSANVVGNCMAKYHPHGDSAIYDTLVRMTQDFSLRYPLVKGQGNFGSIDGDSAAAMRYTEAKLNKVAEEMLKDIEKETVRFIQNFDSSTKEPVVLPSKIPNLLINGSSGIAVGMATNIPPHNLLEVADATIAYIDDPSCTIEKLNTHIKGPDFPTGGIICGESGIRKMYKTGKGKVIVRARSHIEEKKNKKSIIITEIPYMVNKSVLIAHISDLVKEKKITGISDLRDESDRQGMRIVIELKQGINDELILNQLYKNTRLQSTFGAIMIALVDNEPKVLNLKDMISHYVKHRQEIVRKRTEFELKKAEEKAHILEGLIVALDDIDKTIQLIKKSESVNSARSTLIEILEISEIQAQSILDMRLQRLTALEQGKIKDECENLKKTIKELKDILASEDKIRAIIKDELNDMKERYGDERRTKIDHINLDIDEEDLIDEGDNVITISHAGYIKRLPIDTYKIQKRGGKGIIGAGKRDEDFIEDIFIANSLSSILFFTNKGKVHWLKVYQIPESSRQAKGKAIVNLLNLEKDEVVTTFVPVKEFIPSKYVFMATRKGIVKKTNLKFFSSPRKGGIIAINLEKGDELIRAALTDGDAKILLATQNGIAVKFNEKDVRPTGRSSKGVIGIRLKQGDDVIGMEKVRDSHSLLTVTEKGYGKRTKISEYRLINRGGSGVINIQCSERNGKAVGIKNVIEDDDLIFISHSGIVIRVSAKDISEIGRNTQGVRIMKLSPGDKVMAVAKIVKENNDLPEKHEEKKEVVQDDESLSDNK